MLMEFQPIVENDIEKSPKIQHSSFFNSHTTENQSAEKARKIKVSWRLNSYQKLLNAARIMKGQRIPIETIILAFPSLADEIETL